MHLTQGQHVVLAEVPTRFSRHRGAKSTAADALKAARAPQIGPWKVALDWLKNKLAIAVEATRPGVEPGPPGIRRRRPGARVGVARWRLSDPPGGDSAAAVALRRWLDAPYPGAPGDGRRRMTAWRHSRGATVHQTRVRRRRRTMGLATIAPQPRRSPPAEGHPLCPSLRRGVTVERITQVWSAEIPASRVPSGVVALGAVIAWCRRAVLSWAVALTMDGPWWVDARDPALDRGRPARFHTDPGAPCTRHVCTAPLQKGGGRIRMEGRGRALDTVVVARWWHRVQDEAVSRRADHTVGEARQGLARALACSNAERLPHALGSRTPAAVDGGCGQNPAN